ncbi:phytoene desaturase family protein [Chondromyces apiculatus]|uniref:Amine oxidase domain-containing protein n=1 Tax=Chondromyces apiculatus DSM 436 TaxID=1192034 RepID=A0A017T021_9BACT|nr:NAD(P)/FAD-dependent oxidoreductase [Chondromyces apiculatus]EYF02569.1 Hypothetical protein CAP_6776 [Chondromyces apiculatus DSM 436]
MDEGGAPYDALVIGAGFGGLGAALGLAERGARVLLCEALRYPGGCASTFERGGRRFESGATLFSGLGEGQVFTTWLGRHGLSVEVDWLDPVVEVRAPGLTLPVDRDRERFLAALCALPGAPAERLQAFFARQKRVADTLWQLFDDPALLPPLGAGALLRHLARAPRYAELLPLMGRSLGAVIARAGLAECAPLAVYLDGLCQITVQCSAAEAEAPFAMATMDYYWRGTGHVRGGVGALAWAMVEAVRRAGGEVRLPSRVKALRREERGMWRAETRSGVIRARQVIANLLPHDLRTLLGEPRGALPRVDALAEAVDGGWGAAMLYLVVRPPQGAPPGPKHLELVADSNAPFMEGNHVFVSISGEADEGRGPPGCRTITASTHVPLTRLRAMSAGEQATYIAGIQARMRATFDTRAPEWAEGVMEVMTASPRTFQRFTGRAAGAVGGVPRRAGLGHYLGAWPRPVMDGLWMVGDSVFPGQSTLATAVGGQRTAAQVVRALGALGVLGVAPV